MIKILFVCHGNICRSPMAEFVLRDMVNKRGLGQEIFIASAATSSEEIGNPVHRGTRDKLKVYGISVEGKHAVQLIKKDYRKYDHLIGMDERNLVNMMRILGGDPEEKIRRLLDFTNRTGDIADPWYTGDFNQTYNDIYCGCEGLLKYLLGDEA